MKKLVLIVFVLLAGMYSCSGLVDKNPPLEVMTKKIPGGFTPFEIPTANDLLGYIDNGENVFNYKIWEGIVREKKVEQEITIDYNNSSELASGVKFAGIIKDMGAKDPAVLNKYNISRIKFKLINPVEVVLENPFPSLDALNRKSLWDKKVIGSLLKVDRIHMEILDKNGLNISGNVNAGVIKAEGEYKYNKEQNNIMYAKNAYVGYKLISPPANAEELTPFTFEYQVLHQPKGKSVWQVLNIGGEVKTDDYLKVNIRATQTAYVYIFNTDSSGAVNLLLPDEENGYTIPIKANKTYTFPPEEDSAFQVDNVSGIEEYLFLVTRSEKKELTDMMQKIKEKKLKKSDLDNNETIKKTRGTTVAKIASKSAGSGLPVNQVRGLPSDFKEVFYFNHR